MDYNLYMRTEIEKTLFIEIKEDLTLNIEGAPVLKKGEYPVLSEDLINNAISNIDSLTPDMLIKGMLHLIACDPSFRYNDQYIEFVKNIPELKNYIIMHINNNKNNNLKKSIVYTSALVKLYAEKEFMYNKVLLLMQHYENTGLAFLEEEIIENLNRLDREFPYYTPPLYHLGEYYLNKDLDISKIYLRRCLEGDNGEIAEKAEELLNRIKSVDKFDEAVDLIKTGQGLEALKILIPICIKDPENFDAKFYSAVAYRQTENYTKALLYLDELTALAERSEVYSEIALNLAELGDYKTSLLNLKKALKITPDDAGIISNIGVCQLNLGDFEEALKTFELVHRLDPQDDIAMNWIEQINDYYKR